jgi:hypothetical protein
VIPGCFQQIPGARADEDLAPSTELQAAGNEKFVNMEQLLALVMDDIPRRIQRLNALGLDELAGASIDDVMWRTPENVSHTIRIVL